MPKGASSKPQAVDQLENASDDLDRLIHDLRLGIRSQGHFDTLEERGQAIAAAILAAFRGDRPASAAPLHMTVREGGKSSAWY